MKFVGIGGAMQRARRWVSGGSNVSEDEVKDDRKLAELLRSINKRLAAMEAAIPPEGIEFEVTLGVEGAITSLTHNMGTPVRWYVTAWLPTSGVAAPIYAPILIQDSTSTENVLALRSYVEGRAIVRIEQAQNQIEYGVSNGTFSPTGLTPISYLAPGANGQYLRTDTATPTWVNPGKVLANNFTTTSLTAVNTGLFFPVKSGESYEFRFRAMAGDTDAAGMKFAIGAPAASLVDAFHFSSTVNVTTRAYATITAINTLGSAVHTVAGGQRDDEIWGTIKAGADGNVSIQVATVTIASTAQVNKLASLIAFRCSEV